MMDIEKLIERLKEPDCDECTYEEKRECAGSAKCVLSGYAAEALSTLQAENEKLRAELEQAKRERDAAVDCCSGYCASCLFVKDCAKHDMNDAAPTRWYYGDCEDWEWRGWKED